MTKRSLFVSRLPVLGALFVFAVSLSTPACSKTVDDHESGRVDHSDPKRVVSAIFYAAKEGVSSHLAEVCDPKGEANEHAKRICSQAVGQPDWQSFVSQFEHGRLIGEARVAGDRALVNFVFGPKGTDPETMELVLRNGLWYIKSF